MIKKISKIMQKIGIDLGTKCSLPTKSEYIVNYPERVFDDSIACSCGSNKQKPFSAPANVGPIFYKCAGCDVVLFTTNLSGN